MPGRTGMTEARYIEGKYAYLDGLKAKFPHLTIGGCAGGGRETDIESYRRTQMNSRADGYCAGDQLCSQGETYALSLWLPRHGQSQSTMDGLAVDPLYIAEISPRERCARGCLSLATKMHVCESICHQHPSSKMPF